MYVFNFVFDLEHLQWSLSTASHIFFKQFSLGTNFWDSHLPADSLSLHAIHPQTSYWSNLTLYSLLFSFYKNKRTTNKTTLSRVSWICSLHYAWGHKFWQNLSSYNNKIQVQFQDLSLTLKSILYLSVLQNKNRANYMHFYKSKCKEFSQSPTILG